MRSFNSSGSILENSTIKHGGTTFKKTLGAINVLENIDISILDSVIRENQCAFLTFPLPEKEDSAISNYCNNIETKLNILKSENNFCSNMYDTYPLCYFESNPACNT